MASGHTTAASGAERRALSLWLDARRRRRNLTVVTAAALIALCATTPLAFGSAFNLARFGVALAYVIAAIGFNLTFGYAGELVLGHPVVMAAGAYAAAMLSTHAHWRFAAALPVATGAGVIVGLLVMSPGLRVQGWYLALITMFAVLVLPPVVILAEPWTGGEFGLTGIPTPDVFGYRLPTWMTFELTLLCLVLVWLFVGNFVRSSWGHRLRALRDARRAAESVGIDLVESRFVVYAVSSFPAALAGVALAYTERFVNAESFGMSLTLLLLTDVVLGGAGTTWGPVVGMASLLALSFWVGPFNQFNAIALGAGLLVGSLLFTDGLLPALSRTLPASTVRPAPSQARQRASHGDVRVPPADRVVNQRHASTAAAEDPIVDAQNIVKYFGGILALGGVNLALRRGTLVGLVGPNGSGKSTFLNVVSGFIRPDAGRVRIAGIDTAAMKVHEIARCGVGRTFQVPQLVDECTALENIAIGLVGREPRPLVESVLSPTAAARRDVERLECALHTFVDIGLPEHAIHVPAAELPLGMKRIVEVGRAVVSSPRLLLLDEPAAGLDGDERAHLGTLLRRLANGGMTILLVEHNVPFVMEFCDELVLLESGSVTCTATVGAPLPDRLGAYLSYAPRLAHAVVGTV